MWKCPVSGGLGFSIVWPSTYNQNSHTGAWRNHSQEYPGSQIYCYRSSSWIQKTSVPQSMVPGCYRSHRTQGETWPVLPLWQPSSATCHKRYLNFHSWPSQLLFKKSYRKRKFLGESLCKQLGQACQGLSYSMSQTDLLCLYLLSCLSMRIITTLQGIAERQTC
jgi:hypothetical protein